MEGRSPGSGVPTEQHGIVVIGDEPSNAWAESDAATEAMPGGQVGQPRPCLEEEPGPRAGCGKSARPVRWAGTGNGAMARNEAPAQYSNSSWPEAAAPVLDSTTRMRRIVAPGAAPPTGPKSEGKTDNQAAHRQAMRVEAEMAAHAPHGVRRIMFRAIAWISGHT